MAFSFFCGVIFLCAAVDVRPEVAQHNYCPKLEDRKPEFPDSLEEEIRRDDEAVRGVATDEKGGASAHAAGDFDFPELIELLFKIGDNNVDAEVEEGVSVTPLQVAVGHGTAKVAKITMDNGADTNARTGKRNKDSQIFCGPAEDWKCKFLNPLKEAIGKDDQEAIRRLATAVDEKGRTALHAASYLDLLDVVELLLESGANVNAKDEDGNASLHVAAGYSSVKLIMMLVDNGADVIAKTGRRSKSSPRGCEPDDWLCKMMLPLVAAAVNVKRDPAAMRLLMEAADGKGRSFLHVATEADIPELVKLLLQNGFDVDTVDKTGRTAFHVAAEHGRVHITQILLDHGADAKAEIGKQKWEKQQKEKTLRNCSP